ncbi:MAG TPA: hypothetical protein VIR63_04950 [Pontiella sp.]
MKTTKFFGYSLIATLISTASYGERIFFDDFSAGLTSSEPMEYYVRSKTVPSVVGVWDASHEWCFQHSSIINDAIGQIPPADATGGAAAGIIYGYGSILIDKKWESDKDYSFSVRAKATDQNGNPASASLSLQVAGLIRGKMAWLLTARTDEKVAGSDWTIITTTIPGSTLKSISGAPIYLRVERSSGAEQITLWLDTVELSADKAGDELTGSLGTFLKKHMEAEENIANTAESSIRRNASYIASQAVSKFGLSAEKKNKVYTDVTMYLRCRDQISKKTMNGELDLSEAAKFLDMAKKGYENAMVKTVESKFTDSVAALKAVKEFNAAYDQYLK